MLPERLFLRTSFLAEIQNKRTCAETVFEGDSFFNARDEAVSEDFMEERADQFQEEREEF